MCLNDEMYAHKIAKLPDRYTDMESWSGIFEHHILEEMRSCIKADLVLIDTNVLRKTGFTIEDGKLVIIKEKNQELTRSMLVMLVRVEGALEETKFALLKCDPDDQSLIIFNLTCPDSERILDQIAQATEKNWSLYLLSATTTPSMRICDGLESSSKLPMSSCLLREMLSCRPSLTAAESKTPRPPLPMPPQTLSLIKELNKSQKNAVSSVINTILSAESKGSHLQVILGPPGTGKTNTLATLIITILYQSYLPNTSYRLHVSAPTNQAIVELTKRTLANIKNQASSTMTIKCKSSHILLVGNRENLNITSDLEEIFLDARLERLSEGLAGWVSLVGKVETILTLRSPTTYFKSLVNMKNRNGAKNTDHDLSFFILCAASILKDLPDSHLSETNRPFLKKVVGILKNYRSLSVRMTSKEPPKSELETARAQIVYELKSAHSKNIFDVAVKFLRLKRAEREAVIMRSAHVIFSTVSAGGSPPFSDQSFDIAIIDEATQLVEASTSIMLHKDLKCLVLAGDNKQLPSTVISTLAESKGYGRSLFDRLLHGKFPSLLLNVQYRMHPAISFWPNNQFYDGKIINGDNVRTKEFSKYWHSILPPFSIRDVNGNESRSKTGSSSNKDEANVIITVLKDLAKLILAQVKSKENPTPVIIGILSPYKAQCDLLEKMTKQIGPIDKSKMIVICRTIDGFQGQECDIIILTTVRSNQNGSLGFVADCRRLNVAITRPKYSLLLVGNCSTLRTNEVWRSLIDSPPQQAIQYEPPTNSSSIAVAKLSNSKDEGNKLPLKKKKNAKAGAQAKISKAAGEVRPSQPCSNASSTQIKISESNDVGIEVPLEKKKKAVAKAKTRARAKLVKTTGILNVSSTQTKIATAVKASNTTNQGGSVQPKKVVNAESKIAEKREGKKVVIKEQIKLLSVFKQLKLEQLLGKISI